MKENNLVIFASGGGTNAENIANYFKDHQSIHVAKILTNKKDAFVHQRAKKLGIPSNTFTKAAFKKQSFLDILEGIDYVILAGFLWLIPNYLIQAYSNKIINIHPALLPKFGGKGMYGEYVHQAVIKAREKDSGITIHLVNEAYDQGKVLFQAKCEVNPEDTPDTLAYKVHELEYQYFPRVIEDYIQKQG
ncbi:MAG: phosphoribosylglycinamide formyltransferase [Bacteroidota bacterium]